MEKVVVISGGSDGLGKEIARTLSKSHKVIILSPTKEKVEKAAMGLGVDFEVCGVSKWEDVEGAIERIVEKYKRIDCLINNAGLWIQGELEENSPEEVERAVEVNTTGTILLTKATIPVMKKRKSGLIINIISQAGFYARVQRSVYTASKWAVTGFTKALQPELAKYGIGVTGIYPGMINTKLFEKAGFKKSMENSLTPNEVAKVIEFILTFDNKIIFPEIGIKNINN